MEEDGWDVNLKKKNPREPLKRRSVISPNLSSGLPLPTPLEV